MVKQKNFKFCCHLFTLMSYQTCITFFCRIQKKTFWILVTKQFWYPLTGPLAELSLKILRLSPKETAHAALSYISSTWSPSLWCFSCGVSWLRPANQRRHFLVGLKFQNVQSHFSWIFTEVCQIQWSVRGSGDILIHYHSSLVSYGGLVPKTKDMHSKGTCGVDSMLSYFWISQHSQECFQESAKKRCCSQKKFHGKCLLKTY